MKPLTIVADENIVRVKEHFSELGDVICVDGRNLTAKQVRSADVLLVRSVTPVTRQLLQHSRVRFVGSATIGIDHLDTQYLRESGIQWANAPGCNAQSVVEYVLSALCRVGDVLPRLFIGATVGIIGMGNVGSRLYHCLDQLGIACKGYDPLIPRQRYRVLTELDDVLSCDVVCCHAPLTTTGDYPTQHMLNEQRLNLLKPGALLINAGRGGVIDNQALKKLLNNRTDVSVVLDVWEHEPSIDEQLLGQVTYGSAHIAGYSFDGKLAGTKMIYQACKAFLGLPEQSLQTHSGALDSLSITPGGSLVTGIREAVLSVYDIAKDDEQLRNAYLAASNDRRAIAFDQLRKCYPIRRECSNYRIGNTRALDEILLRCLAVLNFAVGIK